jgi:hypothetical protein
MIYINGNKIPYFNTTSYITPSAVEVYPTRLVYGKDYRSGNANKKDESGTGFTVDAMTDYAHSTNNEEFFFTPLLTCMTYEDVYDVGFTIDLGDNKEVGTVQMRTWGITYNIVMEAEISDDGDTFVLTDKITLSPNNNQVTCQFKINNNTRYIRIKIISDRNNLKWWNYAFIARSVEVFAPFRKYGYRFKQEANNE